jgi:phage baseplate assembly protein W
MSRRQRFRALRFVHPDFDAAVGNYGLRVAASGRIDMVDADASVRQAVLLLLTTRPGERVMLPTYGCDLYQLLFAPNDATTAGLAIHYVRLALERWEPRIDILDLDASRSPEDPARLEIRLGYRVRPTLNEEQLTLQLQLLGPPVS